MLLRLEADFIIALTGMLQLTGHSHIAQNPQNFGLFLSVHFAPIVTMRLASHAMSCYAIRLHADMHGLSNKSWAQYWTGLRCNPPKPDMYYNDFITRFHWCSSFAACFLANKNKKNQILRSTLILSHFSLTSRFLEVVYYRIHLAEGVNVKRGLPTHRHAIAEPTHGFTM
ncbi:hypothetical protein BDW74DRAFT_53675 [Aspergillus multicolor]|uniref:uncharacterized protein n=1 Tax=Aspergillus multicolor TaxID=41759 RepID=UPI003CCD2F37